jgi:uncharacterized protein (DUF1800 family)
MAGLAKDLNAANAWAPYEPDGDAPWNRERVVHLHRRAAFGATWAEIERDLADSPDMAVGRLLSGKARLDAAPADFEAMAGTIGDAAQASGSPTRLEAWWFYRMLFSPDPLGERLTLAWHNHFATSNRKVQDLLYMRQQNELLRRHARAPFGELLAGVVKHPAMLAWLDADANRAGRPNENLGRELLELFTLGVGNYTEDDVKAAARALTGWGIAAQDFRFAAARHDEGEIELLGSRGPMSGDDLLRALVEHPATARRVAWRLSTVFFGDGVVDDPTLEALATELHRRQLDVSWAVETMLRSRLFFSPQNLRTRVLGPAEYVVGVVQTLGLSKPPPSTLLLAEWSARMGQELFYPPNVGGWPEGRSWLGSKAVVARANFASALIEGRMWNPPIKPDLSRSVPEHRQADDLEGAAAALAELLWGVASPGVVADAAALASGKPHDEQLATLAYALLASPEAQLG